MKNFDSYKCDITINGLINHFSVLAYTKFKSVVLIQIEIVFIVLI